MIKAFEATLLVPVRIQFKQVRIETETWLRLILDPIVEQMTERKTQLEHRMKNLNKVYANLESIQARSLAINREIMQYQTNSSPPLER